MEDRDTLNNQRSNIRKATQRQNIVNRKCKSKKSEFSGISPHGKKWRAAISVNGKIMYLGLHPSKEEAAKAYDKAAQLHNGEFASLNFNI